MPKWSLSSFDLSISGKLTYLNSYLPTEVNYLKHNPIFYALNERNANQIDIEHIENIVVERLNQKE